MRNITLRATLFAALSVLGLSAAHAQNFYMPSSPMPYTGGGAPWMEAWAGFGSQNNWYGGWAGFNYAFNHNVWSEGFLLRGEGGGGHYDYDDPAFGHVNATYGMGSVLLGYRKTIPGLGLNTFIDGFVGAEYQNQDNPDPFADVRGTEWGVKFLADIYSRLSPYADFFGLASFSTAFDTWQIIARPGILLTSPTSYQIWVGPDMSVFGNGHAWGHSTSAFCPHNSTGGLGSCHYEQGKIGGFVHLINPGWTILGDVLLAAGYQQPMAANTGVHGYYAQIGLYWPIR